MEKKNNLYIPVVKDSNSGSYVYGNIGNKADTIKSVEALRKSGVDGRTINILPVKGYQAPGKITLAGIGLGFILGATAAWFIGRRKRRKK